MEFGNVVRTVLCAVVGFVAGLLGSFATLIAFAAWQLSRGRGAGVAFVHLGPANVASTLLVPLVILLAIAAPAFVAAERVTRSREGSSA